ncbi:hypothetical protein [Halovivax cerinus]|uniref:Uncharacterized protein n=1 Tax=Halovivax cerinus TaxID=1487865 RepID=A0ABD5NSR4_9EURY|nr:hypothetical protein [Halovivax cerinus]
MVLTKSGLGAVLLGSVVALLHLAPGYVTSQLIANDATAIDWLGSTARQIVFLNGFVSAMAFVVGIGVVFLLGYWAGSRLDLRRSYRSFLLVVGVGGGIGYLVPMLLVFGYTALAATGPFQSDQLGTTALVFLGRTGAVAIQFAVVGFAGAALATLSSGTGVTDPSDTTSID